MTRVFYASTLYGAMSLSAALDAGLFGERSERRVLIASTNTAVPEISSRFHQSAGFEPLRSRFDDIIEWNDVIAPMHPSHWVPRAGDTPMLARFLRDHLGLGDVRELVLESAAVPPARTLGMLINDCPVTVYSDGLMSYGPTRDELPLEIGRRIGRLLYLDLVPAVTPLLLREYDVEPQPIPDGPFLKVMAELPEPTVDDGAGRPLIVGQYLAQLGIVTPEEEATLHTDMLRALAAGGHQHVAFKPHPAAGAAHVRPLRESAADLGVQLTVVDDGRPAETWFAAARPSLVVSCFSTALLTAAHYFGIPSATMGTELALERITPYQNSNRIPATIVDATVPRLRPDGSLQTPAAGDVSQLVQAVGYCMQASRNPDLSVVAAAYLNRYGPQRYFKRRRLEAVGLMPAPAYRSAAVRQAGRAAKRAIVRGRAARAAWTAAKAGQR
jgi:hypothetical protein